MKYRKKPMVIDAMQYDGTNLEEIQDKLGILNIEKRDLNSYAFILKLIEGDTVIKLIVQKGDYIIKGISGEFYACNSDNFEMTYEKIEGEE